MLLNNFISDIKLYKINIDNIYLKKIKKENVLLKNTAEGVLFTKIDKNCLNKKNNKELFDLFNNFKVPMYETLLKNIPTKIYLDCDFINLGFLQFCEKEKIIIKLNNYLISFLKNKNINTDNIIYSDASRKKNNNTYKISIHIVINNVYIKNRKILKELIKDFQSTLSHDLLYYNAIDTSVYNQPQLFKCVLSPSKDDNTKLKPFKIENNQIIYYNNNYIINNILVFLSGIYTYETKFIDNSLNYNININEEKRNIEKSIDTNKENIEKSIIPENKKKWILNNNYIKNIYELRNNYIVNNKVDLIRINSAYCKICDRIHDSENAFCKITEKSIFFHCGRNTSNGIAIGYWYSNYKTYNRNNVTNKDTNNLYKTIEDMKIYISNLEEKYNKVKEEFNLLNTIHNKCNKIIETNNKNNDIKNNKIYTKDITSGLWQKYYKLGEYVEKGYNNIVDNIIKSWRDGSIGRLKKRGLLIYEYINYINENNIVNTLSMRKIFHKKNYETFSSLLS